MAKGNTQFSSKLGLLLTTLGSAVGLGCVWRFPAEVQENGGGAFLLIFILCTLVLGIPAMLAEFSVGRAGRGDAIGAMVNLGWKKSGWVIGGCATLACALIMSFYMVVCGWTLEYFVASITGDMFSGIDVNMPEAQIEGALKAKMDYMVHSTWLPLGSTILMLVASVGVLFGGVQKGLERMAKVLMPALFIILLIFVVVAAMAPGAAEGYKYFLEPDFSKISVLTVLNALGQAFFSLSLASAVLVTFGSYFPKDTNLGRTASTVALLGLFVALMVGMIIFPLLLTFNQDHSSVEGTTLIFMTMPELFVYMPMPQLWSILFFYLLLVAAVTSCIALAESLVAFFTQHLNLSRTKACLLVILILLPLTSLCSLSQAYGLDLRIGGMLVFDFINNFATNILLPLGAVMLCVWFGWFAPKRLLESELTNHYTHKIWYYGLVRFTLRFLAPTLIMLVFIESFL